MLMHSFEDWLIGAASVAAVAGVMGAHLLTTPVVSEAIASEPVQAQYTITVTAKRLPAICKTVARATTAECTNRGETTETFTARN